MTTLAIYSYKQKFIYLFALFSAAFQVKGVDCTLFCSSFKLFSQLPLKNKQQRTAQIKYFMRWTNIIELLSYFIQ